MASGKSAMISVGWPIPTNLKFSKEKDGRAGHKATFSWYKIEETDIYRPWDILKPEISSDGAKSYHLLHDKGTIGVFFKGF